MTVRRPEADGNPDWAKLSGSVSRRALLSLREAVILSSGLVAGVVTGVLTYFAVHLAGAVLTGIPAFAGTIKLLEALLA
jgi:hypothetical protein